MRPLLAALLATAFVTVSVEAADRYLVATRTAPREVPLRMLRDSGDALEHRVRTFRTINAFAATLTETEAEALRQSSEVLSVTRVVPRHISGTATPAARTIQSTATVAEQRIPYGIQMIQAPEVWKVTRGAGPINLAVLDTGVDMHHPDLVANIAGGYDVFTGSNNPQDDHGHGTHVAGTIAAADNDFGVVGVAPEVRLWAVKVLDHFGVGTDENIAAGTDWVISKKHEVGGDWIASLSLGGGQGSPVEAAAIKRLHDEGVVIVAAAGNEGMEYTDFPAAYPGVIAVGAVDSAAKLATFSNFGSQLRVVAPGVGVLSSALDAPASSVLSLSSGSTFVAASVQGSVSEPVRGHYLDCGLGNPQDFPPAVKGNIALIRRGTLTFNRKVRNAQSAGATAVILYNDDDSTPFSSWTLFGAYCTAEPCDDETHVWPVVLAISAADGQRLLADPTQYVDMGPWISDYTAFSGTSQATPHVSGTLALIWSLDPGASSDAVENALLSTTTDLGAPGYDKTFGNGLVNALAAGKKLAPWQFLPQPEPPTTDTLRPIP